MAKWQAGVHRVYRCGSTVCMHAAVVIDTREAGCKHGSPCVRACCGGRRNQRWIGEVTGKLAAQVSVRTFTVVVVGAREW